MYDQRKFSRSLSRSFLQKPYKFKFSSLLHKPIANQLSNFIRLVAHFVCTLLFEPYFAHYQSSVMQRARSGSLQYADDIIKHVHVTWPQDKLWLSVSEVTAPCSYIYLTKKQILR